MTLYHSRKQKWKVGNFTAFYNTTHFFVPLIGHGQKGGNHLPTVAVRWHHMFSVMFLPFFFFVCNVKKGQFIQNLA